MATFKEKIKQFWVNVLNLSEYSQNYNITRYYTFQTNAEKNRLWYQGEASELQQFYAQYPVDMGQFWKSTETKGQQLARVHSGVPALMVNSLVNITANSLEKIEFDKKENQKVWEELENDKDFKELLSELTRIALVVGDGAVKYTFDMDISNKPNMDVVPGDRVEFVKVQNFLKVIKFYTPYQRNNTKYTLEEDYGYGYVEYHLLNENGDEVSLSLLPETKDLENFYFDKKYILAVPFKFFDSDKFEDRGRSIYEGKDDAFDTMDEILSQWKTALRTSLPKTYIPTSLIGRDPMNGCLLTPNPFDNRFIEVGDNLGENADNKIVVEQAQINDNIYNNAYITTLDLALQGVLSPSTLGIDVKKLDNAEAQREKEKCTLYTRAAILENLDEIIISIIKTAFNTLAVMYGKNAPEIDLSVSFGEYANPSFEAVVEVMSNPNTPMSIEAKVEELWGDSKDEQWKKEEIARIKNERGIVELDEPALNQSFIEEVKKDDQNL